MRRFLLVFFCSFIAINICLGDNTNIEPGVSMFKENRFEEAKQFFIEFKKSHIGKSNTHNIDAWINRCEEKIVEQKAEEAAKTQKEAVELEVKQKEAEAKAKQYAAEEANARQQEAEAKARQQEAEAEIARQRAEEAKARQQEAEAKARQLEAAAQIARQKAKEAEERRIEAEVKLELTKKEEENKRIQDSLRLVNKLIYVSVDTYILEEKKDVGLKGLIEKGLKEGNKELKFTDDKDKAYFGIYVTVKTIEHNEVKNSPKITVYHVYAYANVKVVDEINESTYYEGEINTKGSSSIPSIGMDLAANNACRKTDKSIVSEILKYLKE